MESNQSAQTAIRETVARADRRRRTRVAVCQLATQAPAAAGLALLTAAVGRLAGWPSVVALGLGAALVVAVALRTWLVARARPATDATAARIDTDAGLRGELRSAHWFADQPADDPWTGYHLEQAADHTSRVDWTTLYPPVRAGRSWVGTGALVAAALVTTLWVGPQRAPSAAELALADLAALGETLPPELQARLQQLLASMEGDELTAEELATLEELQALMDQLDPSLMDKIAQLAEEREIGSEGEQRQMDPDELADLVENSAAGMPEDVRWALEDLAARLANANAERETNPDNPSATSETGESALGSPQAETEQGAAQDAGMQLMRQAASEAGEGQMMMAGAGAMGGDSSAGEGGNSGQGSGDPEEFLSIAQALRQELIEAADDTLGENVENEDIRRKTEEASSELGFTRVAPATFDRSRAVGPPEVPDARRPLLFTYFIRRQ